MGNMKYEQPKILSQREGFACDHSTQCYGCPVCGKFGRKPSIDRCQLCGWWPSDRSNELNTEYCDYCAFSRNDGDPCTDANWLCSDHHRRLKFTFSKVLMRELQLERVKRRVNKDSDNGQYFGSTELFNPNGIKDGDNVTISMCVDCYDTYFKDKARFCAKCDSCVLPGIDSTCPFCKGALIDDFPDPWTKFKHENPLNHLVMYVKDPNYIPDREQVKTIFQIFTEAGLIQGREPLAFLNALDWNSGKNVHAKYVMMWDTSIEDDEKEVEEESEEDGAGEAFFTGNSEVEMTYMNPDPFYFEILKTSSTNELNWDKQDNILRYVGDGASYPSEERIRSYLAFLARLSERLGTRFLILNDMVGYSSKMADFLVKRFLRDHESIINKISSVVGNPIVFGIYTSMGEEINFKDSKISRTPTASRKGILHQTINDRNGDVKPEFIPSVVGGTYRYEMVEGSANKYWEIEIFPLSYEVRFGRMGAKPQLRVKEFQSESETLSESNKIRALKETKGYILVKKTTPGNNELLTPGKNMAAGSGKDEQPKPRRRDDGSMYI